MGDNLKRNRYALTEQNYEKIKLQIKIALNFCGLNIVGVL